MTTRSTAVLHGFSPPVPDAVARRAAGFPSGGQPAEASLSASVVLLRDADRAPSGAGRVETYVLHRHSRMPFAPSVAVFPGGRVDPVDQAADDAVLACAVRETQEETGVRLEPAALHPWAHWITPECEPLRFDTYFYVARIPADAEAEDLSGETDRAEWLGVAQALEQRERHALTLMPPTWAILVELSGFADVAAVLAAAQDRQVETVRPRLVPTGSGWAYEYQVLEE